LALEWGLVQRHDDPHASLAGKSRAEFMIAERKIDLGKSFSHWTGNGGRRHSGAFLYFHCVKVRRVARNESLPRMAWCKPSLSVLFGISSRFLRFFVIS
jgi:hypothetical protein